MAGLIEMVYDRLESGLFVRYQNHQPLSAFKPLVLLTYLEQFIWLLWKSLLVAIEQRSGPE